MEAKKTHRADLQNRRFLFIEIGLVIALFAVVGAFAWGQSERIVEGFTENVATVEEEVIVNTRPEPPPPPAKPQPREFFSDLINVVKDDTKITNDYSFDEFDENLVIEVPQFVEEVVEEVPVYKSDEMPSFMGGDIDTFRDWVMTNVEYPVIARENGLTGKVVLYFVIERDGTLSGIEVLSSPDRSFSEAAVAALKKSPKWVPGKTNNRPVRVFFTIPIDFVLQGNL